MERVNLKVLGSNDNQGGLYGDILIMGSGDIKGDVECTTYKVFGSGDIHGNLKSETVKINGSGDIYGDVEAEDIIINGSGDVHGTVRCGMMKIAGSGDIYKDVYAKEVNIYGSSDIKGNCETEMFNGKGSFEVFGMLNAEEVNIEVAGECKIKEIGAARVIVKEKQKFEIKAITKKNKTKILECDIIEGDDIYLENTHAKIVRGGNIVIGENCKIDFIEYKNQCDIDAKSKVGENQKLLK